MAASVGASEYLQWHAYTDTNADPDSNPHTYANTDAGSTNESASRGERSGID